MIGKLELNFVSPELVTDSYDRNVVIQHRRYCLSFIDRFKHTCIGVLLYIKKSSVANLNLSSVDLGTLSLFQVLLLNTRARYSLRAPQHPAQ
jgi:hypothetical protein